MPLKPPHQDKRSPFPSPKLIHSRTQEKTFAGSHVGLGNWKPLHGPFERLPYMSLNCLWQTRSSAISALSSFIYRYFQNTWRHADAPRHWGDHIGSSGQKEVSLRKIQADSCATAHAAWRLPVAGSWSRGTIACGWELGLATWVSVDMQKWVML